jgi:hypothetical protein
MITQESSQRVRCFTAVSLYTSISHFEYSINVLIAPPINPEKFDFAGRTVWVRGGATVWIRDSTLLAWYKDTSLSALEMWDGIVCAWKYMKVNVGICSAITCKWYIVPKINFTLGDAPTDVFTFFRCLIFSKLVQKRSLLFMPCSQLPEWDGGPGKGPI